MRHSETSRQARTLSALSLAIFTIGVAAAVVSSMATYRSVGVYGGPVASGFHFERDPSTGRRIIMHERLTKSGTTVRTRHGEDLLPERTELNAGGLSVSVERTGATTSGTARVGFSIANDGVIDAWATHDAATGETRVEISTRRDGRIDRWERYKGKSLVRVDLDINGNGKADRWMTYQDGILTATVIDANEDGEADSVPWVP